MKTTTEKQSIFKAGLLKSAAGKNFAKSPILSDFHILYIDEYVTKPFDMDILLMTIKAILRRAKIETEKKLLSATFP